QGSMPLTDCIPIKKWPEGDIPVSHGEPWAVDEVADAILFLASPKARHITGIPLWIDGGQGLLRYASSRDFTPVEQKSASSLFL
ncbi:MAG: hypothetical protein ACT6U0_27755, partial [Shinella sp.]